MPGKTSWVETERFLNSFASIGDFWGKDVNDYQSIIVRFPSPVTYAMLEQTYQIRDEQVIAIQIYNYDIKPTFYLQNILADYGQPNMVAIFTYRIDDNMGNRPTAIIVFYQQKGILLVYVGVKSINNIDNHIHICPSGTYNFLSVWDPSLNLSFDEAIERFGFGTKSGLPYPIQLQKASNMSVVDFYQTYKNPSTTSCIDTPLEIWPNP